MTYSQTFLPLLTGEAYTAPQTSWIKGERKKFVGKAEGTGQKERDKREGDGQGEGLGFSKVIFIMMLPG